MKKLTKYLNNNWIVFGLLALLAAALYANVIHGQFIWDDRALIVENDYIKSFSNMKNWFLGLNVEGLHVFGKTLYRPITTLIYATLYNFFGLNSVPFHIFSVLAHVFSSFFVFVLLKRLKFNPIGSLFAAILFLIHPVQTTSVSYIAGVPDVMSGFFLFAGLILFTYKKNLAYLGSLLCFGLSLLSKEAGIVAIPLAILISFIDNEKTTKQEAKKRNIVLGIMIMLTLYYLYFRFALLDGGKISLSTTENEYTQHLYIRIITFISILWEYAKLIFAPIVLYFDRVSKYYSDLLSLRGAFGLFVIIGGLIGSYFSFKKTKQFFVAFFWFFIGFGPVMGIVVANTIYRENWLYIPLVGVCMMLAAAWSQMKTKRSQILFTIIFILASALFGIRTIYRNFEWADPYKFFENEITYNQYSPRTFSEYGKVNYRDGKIDEALELFQKGIYIALPKEPILTSLHYNSGTCYVLKKELNKAISEYLMVFETNPNYQDAHEQLSSLFSLGHYDARAAKFSEFSHRISTGGTVTFEEILATKDLQ